MSHLESHSLHHSFLNRTQEKNDQKNFFLKTKSSEVETSDEILTGTFLTNLAFKPFSYICSKRQPRAKAQRVIL